MSPSPTLATCLFARMISASDIAEALFSCTYVYDHCQHSILAQEAMLMSKTWETPHGMEIQIHLRAFPSFQLEVGKGAFLSVIRKLAIFGVDMRIGEFLVWAQSAKPFYLKTFEHRIC